MKWENIKALSLLCGYTDDHILWIMNKELSSLHIGMNIRSNIYTRLTNYENTL